MRAVLYARVSTDLQEKEATIQSQVEALRKYGLDKGYTVVGEYLDEGYSGATLTRPSLEKLRDALPSDDFDVILVHSPDRLARKVVYLVILREESQKHGKKLEFLNYPIDDSPEGDMLFGMQGIFAEYERAKILERTRRGKLQRAREGAMVGGHAPYGYRFIRRTENQRARLEVSEYEASVIRKMYRLLVEEKLSTWAIAKLLTEQGVVTAKGAGRWQPTAVHRMLTNPAYKGSFEYRHSPSEVVSIPVPPIIDEATWEATQAQLKENSLYSSRNNKHNSYLLRGLIRCPRCGGAYTGYLQRGYRGYRCNRAHTASSSTGKRCSPGSIRAKPVEDAVWAAIKGALQSPDLLNEEYERRLDDSGTTDSVEYERKQLAAAQKRLEVQGDRVTDAYINEAIDLSRYKIEMEKLRGRRENLDRVTQELDDKANRELSSRDALEHLRRFCDQVSQGLDVMTCEERQQLLRLVVERITVVEERVTVETVIPTSGDDVKLHTRHGEPVEP